MVHTCACRNLLLERFRPVYENGFGQNEKYTQWKIVIAVGLVMGIHAGIRLLTGAEFKLSDMITYLPASSMYILSMIIGYIGLRYLVLSVSTPICNCSGRRGGRHVHSSRGTSCRPFKSLPLALSWPVSFCFRLLNANTKNRTASFAGRKIDEIHSQLYRHFPPP